jgi:hypothetical protein
MQAFYASQHDERILKYWKAPWLILCLLWRRGISWGTYNLSRCERLAQYGEPVLILMLLHNFGNTYKDKYLTHNLAYEFVFYMSPSAC